MKKIVRILALFSAVLFFAVTNSKAQEIVIGVRPVHPVIVARPFRPSPRHVWVSEEYVPAGGAYTYRAGYWAIPPHPGAVWVPGHWKRHPRGFVWVPGRWRY